MATIPGSQFVATAGALSVNVVETTTGSNVPSPVGGAFNLEVFVGPLGSAPTTPAPGYQGLAVLSPSGLELDLISGAFAVTDNGIGNDTLNARGDNETVAGGSANVTLNLFGNNDVAQGGGQDTIGVYGSGNEVDGAGNDLINVIGSDNTINAGSGNDTINLFGTGNSVDFGTGHDVLNVFMPGYSLGQSDNDTINVFAGSTLTLNETGNGNTINYFAPNEIIDGLGSTGSNTFNLYGAGDTLLGGSGSDTLDAFAANDVVVGILGNDSINTYGAGDSVFGGAGSDTINFYGGVSGVDAGTGTNTAVNLFGLGDTVTAGANVNAAQTAVVNMGGPGATFIDGPNQYSDTIVGFSEASGDTINLSDNGDTVLSTALVNGGLDTQINLSDGSTIVLKGVTHIDPGFFS